MTRSNKRDVDYAIRMPANKSVELEIEDILFRLPGRPSRKPLVALQEFPLSGEELDYTQTDRCQGRAPPR